MNAISLRTGFLSAAFITCAAAVAWSSLSACASLSQTSPLPPDDASDLDAGSVPNGADEAGSTSGGSVDSGPPATSGRIRLSNLLTGGPAIDLCAKADSPSVTTWTSNLITQNPSEPPEPDGLKFGETSQSVFLNAAAGSKGSAYVFRAVPAGADCNDSSTTILASFASQSLKQNAGITLVAVGKLADGVDAGDANPRGAAMGDVIAPPSSASLFRVFHGVSDIAAFDVVINGETDLNGIKYGSAFGFPYTSTTGYASIAAGVPEDATLTLRSGTTVRSFTIPQRLRRGIATTVFVGGTKDNLLVNLCSDRTPDQGPVATCTKLVAQQ
jgi:hypothetical protein